MLERFLYDNFPLFDKKKLIVAISGGIDSMVLLDLLIKAKTDLVVCHVNHHTRNGTSSHDSQFVKKICQANNLEFYQEDFHHTAGNFQNASRNFRYEFFNSIKYQINGHIIITAHHKDDAIETFIHNALRGSGIKGLRGIKHMEGIILRPLINFTKEEIIEYGLLNNIPYVEDDSNTQNEYTRNKIRNKILPILKESFPHISKNISSSMEVISQDYNLLQSLIVEKAESLIENNQKEVIVDIDGLKAQNYGPTLLYHFISHLGFTFQQAVDCMNADTGSMFYTDTHIANKDRGKLVISRIIATTISVISIPSPGNYTIDTDRCLSIIKAEDNSLQFKSGDILLDADKIKFPMNLRRWENGDKFLPAGMGGRSKKVSKFLKDIKIPRIKKNEIYVLFSEEDICCIPNYRADERFKRSPDTLNTIIVRVTTAKSK